MLGTDEGARLDARDVRRIRQGKVGVGLFFRVERGERAGLDQLVAQRCVLLGGAVSERDSVGLRQFGNLTNPGE